MGGESREYTSIFLNNTALLYKGIDVSLNGGVTSSTETDGTKMDSTVSLATTALAQTPSFWHAGADLLRSKSLDRNSYNSGDWFNAIDWSGQESTFGRGLPQAADNQAKWVYQQPLLADPALVPTPSDIAAATAQAQDLLRLRASTPLFHLGSADLIEQRVTFPGSGPDATPGVVVMHIDDPVTAGTPRRGGCAVTSTGRWTACSSWTTQVVGSAGRAPVPARVVRARQGDNPVVRATT